MPERAAPPRAPPMHEGPYAIIAVPDPPCSALREFTGAGTNRMRLSVRMRIHCGMGRFCLSRLASVFLVRRDLWAGCGWGGGATSQTAVLCDGSASAEQRRRSQQGRQRHYARRSRHGALPPAARPQPLARVRHSRLGQLAGAASGLAAGQYLQTRHREATRGPIILISTRNTGGWVRGTKSWFDR